MHSICDVINLMEAQLLLVKFIQAQFKIEKSVSWGLDCIEKQASQIFTEWEP